MDGYVGSVSVKTHRFSVIPCLPASCGLLLDGGADGPHGGPRRHPACQPLQGEDVHV